MSLTSRLQVHAAALGEQESSRKMVKRESERSGFELPLGWAILSKKSSFAPLSLHHGDNDIFASTKHSLASAKQNRCRNGLNSYNNIN